MDIREKILAADVPVRDDGYVDFNKWREFLVQADLSILQDIISAQALFGSISDQGILLQRAADTKKHEIANAFIGTLCAEGLTTQNAISVLDLAKESIMKCTFTQRCNR